ncbi:hypothetical protein BJY04DRAFT_213724 [Aspergillus karnatakaensis]|uniref:amine oxidase, flavin-containing superfamily n=1 Tax=Aspergillus karnatakaensis TaxID=1810916 RepID=UPI003CCE3B83
MSFSARALLLVILADICLGSVWPFAFHVDDPQVDQEFVITRDVAIIGGGASGTYAAVRLQELNHSVVLIEREERLGGHTKTYYAPEDGSPIDYGVWVYSDTPESRRFFAHFNIPIGRQIFSRNPVGSQRLDFRNGQRVPPPGGNLTEAMMRYVGVLSQYPYLDGGWDLPYPVPEDLLIPFRDFIEKYDLGPAVETLTLYVQGFANILNYPTVYILKYFNFNVVRGSLEGFLRPISQANVDLYNVARRELGVHVLLGSTVISLERSDTGLHRIIVETPLGKKYIEANKLIVTTPPIPDLLRGFDLDSREQQIFGRFNFSGYYTSVMHIPNYPNNTQIINKGVDTPYNIAALPGTYVFIPTQVRDLAVGYVGGGPGYSYQDVIVEIIHENARSLRTAGIMVGEPQMRAYGDHAPFGLYVSAEEIAAGFYRDLYSLQGHHKTWYTGAAFHCHDSGALWSFTERLLNEHFSSS